MERDEKTGVRARVGEDRLSTILAAVIVAANVFGGGALALFKALNLPPLVPSPPGIRESEADANRSWRGSPSEEGEPAVAGLDPHPERSGPR